MHVFLRKLKPSDANRFTELANNKKLWLNMRDGFPHPYTTKDAVKFISFSNDIKTNSIFGIIYNDELVGATGLHGQADINRFSMELGYWIGEPYWGKGIATKAVALITDFGFKNLDINRIFAGTIEGNLASTKVLEKNSYKFEGVSRKSAFKNNEFKDEFHFAILKTDYLSNQRDKKQL
jgi:RimJ/RimL family protein N-acetyltransferase